MHGYRYESASKSWPSKFLYSNSDLITMGVRPSNSYGTHFVIGEFSVHNRSGSTVTAGVGGRIQPSLWRFYFWDESEYAAGSALIDDTTDAQSTAAGDVNLDTVGTNNDGFAIGCDAPFNIVSLNVSQISDASTVWAVYYSVVSAGTGFSNNFTALTNLHVAPSFGTGKTGEQLIWFDAPPDWHRVTSSSAIINRHGRSDKQALGYSAPGEYLLVVKSTTAPDTTRGQITQAMLGNIVMTQANVLTNQTLTNIGGAEIHLPAACDAVCAAISTANVQNRCDMKWRYSG
ncbi:MAG: hypothetical protein OEY86_00905 [Nitrospira sp.]|nr:hypothetical protein [Nitrospira sp.]